MAELVETKKIDILQIDSTHEEATEEWEKPLELEDPATLARMPWREYLRRANYNQDPDLMCKLCIEQQKKKFNGRTPIICHGYNTYKEQLSESFGDVLEEVEKHLTQEELDTLNAEFDPVTWWKINTKNPDLLQTRFYQQMVMRCTAKNIALRQGRRCGKTFSIAMKVIHKIAVSKKPIEVLVVAPQITMINEIVQTLETLCDNLTIEGFIQSKKSQPILEMKFFNGSLLKGITSGVDGKAARGKRADLIWIDEVDFVVSKAMEAIKGVQLDNPNVEMVYTSTPIGQGNLYTFAQLEITKEFHYPTFANPMYTDAMHETIKDLSDVAYSQEILALQGVDEAGVFPTNYVDRSFESYEEHTFNREFVFRNRDRFIIFIGVDWNHDNNGTRIVVVAYDKMKDKFFVLDKHKIAKLQMTQALAVEKVVEVNREYEADHILCDEGFGTAQISQLRLKGEEQYGKVPVTHPDIKLVDTVSVNFGSTLTIIDPVTHQPLKRNTKQYIVEHAAKLLEDGRLSFHADKDEELILQMKNYHIANKGVRGNIYKPKNKKIGDHDLDAYMLGLYGFEMFYSNFIKPQAVEYGTILSANTTQYSAMSRDVYEGGAKFSSSPTHNMNRGRGVRRAKSRRY